MRRTVRSYLRPYLPAFVFALAQVIFISALELLKPWPLKVVIDHVLTETAVPWDFAQTLSSQNLLLLACVFLVVVYLLLGGLRIVNDYTRSEEHTSELQSLRHLVCRLLLEKKNTLL